MNTDEIIRKLQSRIDSNSNSISECWRSDFTKDQWKSFHNAQALDKRIMGELVRLQRNYKAMTKNFLEG